LHAAGYRLPGTPACPPCKNKTFSPLPYLCAQISIWSSRILLKKIREKLYHEVMGFLVAFLLALSLLSCSKDTEIPIKQKAATDQASESQYKKEMEEVKKNLKGDIKIKLKKEGKGTYSWEITGKDAQEVLKTNETLRKRLVE
jgi:hypothetical protein